MTRLNSLLDRRNWGSATRLLALLVLESVLLVFLLSALLTEVDLTVVVERNVFPPGARETLLRNLLAGLSVTILAGVLALYRFGTERVTWFAKALSPLIPLSASPALLLGEFWFRHPLEFLLSLLLCTILAEVAARAALETLGVSLRKRFKSKGLDTFARSPRLPLILAASASLLYFFYSAHLTIIDHRRFFTGGYDMAIFDNLMWNALHGEPFKSSVMYGDGPGNSLAGHAELGMLLFVPFYAISPGSEALLWIQAGAVASSGFVFFLFARSRISEWWATALTLIYFLYAPIHGAQFYDFHWLTIAPPFVFLLFYGLSIKKKRVVFPALIALFLIREDLAPGIAILGTWLLLTGSRPKFGALLALAATAWFTIEKFVIMPYFGTWFFADLYKNLAVPGEAGYGSVFKTLLSNPVFVFRNFLTTPKLIYALHLLVPLALIPVRRSLFLPLLIPGTVFTLLTNWPATLGLSFHYSNHFTPYLFGITVLALEAWRKDAEGSPVASRIGLRVGSALSAMAFATIIHTAAFGMVINPQSFSHTQGRARLSLSEDEKKTLTDFESLTSVIPETASVTCTDYEVAHLSNRRLVYAVGQSLWAGEYFVTGEKSFPLGRTRQNIKTVLDAHPYGFVDKVGPFTLWKLGHESQKTPLEKRVLYRKMGLLPHPARPRRARPRASSTP